MEGPRTHRDANQYRIYVPSVLAEIAFQAIFFDSELSLELILVKQLDR
jgi:hypothetical protein